MIYLSGHAGQAVLAEQRLDLGLMIQPGMGTYGPKSLELAWRPWAGDNGCFAQGDKFNPGAWLEWLASQRRWAPTCHFAVAPDVMGDAAATLAQARPYLAAIRILGLPAAYVAQNGSDLHPPPWDALDCLFIGGDDAFKLGAVAIELMAQAHSLGKWVHVGRVNTRTRLEWADAHLADSVDGTFLKFGPDKNLPYLLSWLDRLAPAAA